MPPGPSAAETAAVAAAVALWQRSRDGDDDPAAPPQAWSLAMRLPDLEIDDVRALARGVSAACSTRF